MGRIADRLPVFSGSALIPDFNLADADFSQLENSLGKPIPAAARDDLQQICRVYIHWKHVENNAAQMKEAYAAWSNVRCRLEGFIGVGNGEIRGSGDAGQWVDGLLFDILETLPIALTERDLEPSTLDPLQSGGHKNCGQQLTITPNFAMRMGIAFGVAIDRMEATIAGFGPGFRPGAAFVDWLDDMRRWAGDLGYPHGAGGERVSKFARFLYRLHGLMPEDLREAQMNSESAMNARLRRARPGANT